MSKFWKGYWFGMIVVVLVNIFTCILIDLNKPVIENVEFNKNIDWSNDIIVDWEDGKIKRMMFKIKDDGKIQTYIDAVGWVEYFNKQKED